MSSWDEEPRLDERRASAADVPKHYKKKKTRRWCKGKVGVEHKLEVVLDERTMSWRRHANPDRPSCYRPDWLVNSPMGRRRSETWSWMCSHIRRCTVCGKITDHYLGVDCPIYTSKTTVFRDDEIQKIKDTMRGD